MSDSGYSSAIWRGKFFRVREAEEMFRADPDENLLTYASALYSFKIFKKFRSKLLALRVDLMAQAERLPDFREKRGARAAAVRAEMLSAFLYWVYTQDSGASGFGFRARAKAEQANKFGLRLTEDSMVGDHTRLLLMITALKIDPSKLEGWYDEFSVLAPHVTDINQKARVYRGFGSVLVASGEKLLGQEWIWAAIRMKGLPLAVQAKNLLALVTA